MLKKMKRIFRLTCPEHGALVPGSVHVAVDFGHSQAGPSQSGKHLHFPHSHFPLSEQILLSRRSQEKLSHSQKRPPIYWKIRKRNGKTLKTLKKQNFFNETLNAYHTLTRRLYTFTFTTDTFSSS